MAMTKYLFTMISQILDMNGEGELLEEGGYTSSMMNPENTLRVNIKLIEVNKMFYE